MKINLPTDIPKIRGEDVNDHVKSTIFRIYTDENYIYK